MKSIQWWIISYLMSALDFLLGIYFYVSIKGVIPTHFNFSGEPTTYGKPTLLYWMLIPLVHISIIILLNIVYYYRWTLISKYPYLINIPAFMMMDGRIDESKKQYYIDRVYSILSFVGVYIGILMILIEFGIGYSSLIKYYSIFFTLGMIILTILLVLGIILYYKNIYRDYREELFKKSLLIQIYLNDIISIFKCSD